MRKATISNGVLVLVFVSVLASLVLPLGQQAFAHGVGPSSCQNRYDGSITSAQIVSEGKTYDPIANPGLTFKLENNMTYTLTFTIHTPEQSSQGNSLNGTTWYRTTANNYGFGICINDIGPNQDIVITHQLSHPGMAPETTQEVEYGTVVSEFYYHVKWVNPGNNGTTVADPPMELSATAVSPSQIDLSWKVPEDDGGLPITEYRIESHHSTSGGGPLSYHEATVGPADTEYSDTGLDANMTYYYRVYAINQKGTSYPSNIASTTTLAAPPSTATILVNSADLSGNTFDGMWVELWQNGEIIQEGPTPFSATVQLGADYEVFMNNWENIIFDHWESGDANTQRPFNIDVDTQFTAFFNTNSPPTAGDDKAHTGTNKSVTIDVLTNDSDPDEDSLSVDSISIEPMHGTVIINSDGTITYKPNFAFVGSDSFNYLVSDGMGGTDTAIVSITVNVIRLLFS